MFERPILFSADMVRAICEGRKTQTRRLVDVDRLRVVLPREVRPDYAALLPPAQRGGAAPGTHPASLNPHGAVSARLEGFNGYGGPNLLGLRPGEFDFACPYARETVTRLEGEPTRRVWTLYPRDGARLWVREAFQYVAPSADCDCARQGVPRGDKLGGVRYAATWDRAHELGWRPSIHMPRWASRGTLSVRSIRLERLQSISEADARAEGVQPLQMDAGSYRPRFEGLWDTINGKRASWASNPWVWAITFGKLERGEGAS